MRQRHFIGELARITGLNTNTIRYYESQGLLLPTRRTESGYRVYCEQDVARLTFIQKAKAIGLSLAEVKEIIDHQSKGSPPCQRVAALLDQKIAELDRRMQDLQAFREELTTFRQRMEPGLAQPVGAICGYIEGVKINEKGDHDGTQN